MATCSVCPTAATRYGAEKANDFMIVPTFPRSDLIFANLRGKIFAGVWSDLKQMLLIILLLLF